MPSQLTQLKSALSKAGITPHSNNKNKKRKRNDSSLGNDREKKAARLNEIHRQLNPFDVKVTKLKHDVIGRKIKGIGGQPAKSKQVGLDQRKKTLLKEFEQKNHAGGFIDRRFGENDPTMSLEERMLERFTKERQRNSRGGVMFNLEDEDELTHYGQSLSKLDDFDDAELRMSSDQEEDNGSAGQLGANIISQEHFGGFDQEDDDESELTRKKSKAEVMAEVIAKSKEHKLLRQAEREQEEKLRMKLDADFDSLRSLLYTPSLASVVDRHQISESTSIESHEPPAEKLASVADETYDRHVRELAFDQRAKPKDRTKTEEEIALEEKEALEKAERNRRRRMLGEAEDSEQEEGGKGSRNRRRVRGGDDLEDDFMDQYDDNYSLGEGLGSAGDEGSDSGAGSSQDEPEDLDTDEQSPTSQELVSPDKVPSGLVKSGKIGELPFTFPCPSSHAEFLDIIQDISDKDVPIAVKRIRTLYHPSLAPGNKQKMEALAMVLIDHAVHIASREDSRFDLLSALIPDIVTLTKTHAITSAASFVEKLAFMHKNLKRGLAVGPLSSAAKTWPDTAELTLLRLIGAIWPSSDLNHAVITPARLLMAAYLGLCRVRSLQDLSSGLFLSTLFLQYEQVSQRYVPEALNFVVNAILHLSPHQFEGTDKLPGNFPSPDFSPDLHRLLVLDSRSPNLEIRKCNLTKRLLSDDDGQDKVDLLGLSLDLLSRFAELYKGLDAFVEIFQPIQGILEGIKIKQFPPSLQNRYTRVASTLSRLLKYSTQSRKPLLLQAHKPIPIASYIPKFDSSTSSYLRKQDPDYERNQAAKLRNQYKQERKGAIRELRKDARFLASVEQQRQKEKDQEYRNIMNKKFASIEGERAEQKAMEREKNKEKRRAGRK